MYQSYIYTLLWKALKYKAALDYKWRYRFIRFKAVNLTVHIGESSSFFQLYFRLYQHKHVQVTNLSNGCFDLYRLVPTGILTSLCLKIAFFDSKSTGYAVERNWIGYPTNIYNYENTNAPSDEVPGSTRVCIHSKRLQEKVLYLLKEKSIFSGLKAYEINWSLKIVNEVLRELRLLTHAE